jgi:hypothetical protein
LENRNSRKNFSGIEAVFCQIICDRNFLATNKEEREFEKKKKYLRAPVRINTPEIVFKQNYFFLDDFS